MIEARWVLSVLSLTTLAACAPWRGPDDVARVVSRGTDARYDRESGLTLGRFGLSMARWAVEEDEDVFLDGLRKIEVGVYRRTDERTTPLALSAASFPDWTPIVEVRTDPEERVLILGDAPEGAIRGLLIVVAEEDELTVVRMRGRLDAILDQAVVRAFDQVGREELAEPSIAAIEAERRGP
jgi:hypothetical protein